MNFASDNVYGVHPAILQALSDANAGTAASYGYDDLTKRAQEELSRVFEKDVKAFLVTTGTAANGLALSAIAPGYGAVFAHCGAHVFEDECNSPEFFTGGAKILGLSGGDGKVTPASIGHALRSFVKAEHDPKPKGISITNATELGTVYRPGEIAALSAFGRERGMKLHMDGARFANALAASGATPAELTWKSGVDVLSFGGTKNGAMMLEAVIFFDLKLAEEFEYRRMRGGQLVSKSRYLAAQMLAYLADGLWLGMARNANKLAARLAKGLSANPAIRIPLPVEANIIWAIMPRSLFGKLVAAGVRIAARRPPGLIERCQEEEAAVRMVTSFSTPEADIERFVALVSETQP
ncbi:MAG: low specificity L-threonine aldolase [Rhizobiales bacterium]|nr:low specificity L-threonine aldolase [Hyphomicrobiales bacterium]